MCTREILVGSLTSSSQASLSQNLRVLLEAKYIYLHVMLSSIFLSALRCLSLILLGNEHICFACCNRTHKQPLKIDRKYMNPFVFSSKRHFLMRKQKVHVFHASISYRIVFENRYTYLYMYIYLHLKCTCCQLQASHEIITLRLFYFCWLK